MEQKDVSQNLLPTVFVIFGATGDLMQSKLAPALFRLYQKNSLPKLFHVIGFARREMTSEEFQRMVQEMVQKRVSAPKKEIEKFSKFFAYQQGLFSEEEGYGHIAQFLGRKDNQWRVCANKLFYLAVPPEFYKTIFHNLDKSGLTEPCSPEEGWTRVIVEKPFGKDLKTAQELDRLLGKLFREEQIYRIDHYLAKETVQNILAFRFSNAFFEPVWNSEAVESISIRLFEKKGVGNRGSFYDGVGALRDVGQNHLLQLLALFTMEHPRRFDADFIRAKRAETLRALPRLSEKQIQEMTLRGQYEGFRNEKDVDSNSTTETYFRIKTSLNIPRWQGVPIYLESGKAMKENRVEAVITFRHPDACLCPPDSEHCGNTVYYRVQPQEGVTITFWVKKPGSGMVLEQKDFSFHYKEVFEKEEFIDAYEMLLLNVVKGDQTLFVSTEEIFASWQFIDPILRVWQKNSSPPLSYEKFSGEISKVLLPVDMNQ